MQYTRKKNHAKLNAIRKNYGVINLRKGAKIVYLKVINVLKSNKCTLGIYRRHYIETLIIYKYTITYETRNIHYVNMNSFTLDRFHDV